jgi:hypothetical protein
VHGATAVGELWRLYVAHEPEPWHYGIVCVRLDGKHEFHNRLTRGDDQNICTIWTGVIQAEDSCSSIDFLWLMERIKRWSLGILCPQVQTWLGYSQLRAPEGDHA